MKQAFILCNEIDRFRKLRKTSKSKQFSYQCSKHVKRLEKDLKQYCIFRGFNYKEIWNNYNKGEIK